MECYYICCDLKTIEPTTEGMRMGELTVFFSPYWPAALLSDVQKLQLVDLECYESTYLAHGLADSDSVFVL
jgi:hypothetical protein